MDKLEAAAVIDSVNGLAEAQCVDATRFTKPDCAENGEICGNSDGCSRSETETEAEPLEDCPNDELVDNGESMFPVSSLDSAASEDVSDGSAHSSKMDEDVDQINFFPDFIIFNEIYARNALVIFSENCVEAKGLDVCADQSDFHIQLKVDDIVSIESIWVERTQTAMAKIRVISEGSVETENDRSLLDIKELRFSVTDFSWFEKREEVLSLNPRYGATWTSNIDTGLGEYGDMHFPASYIPSFNPFEDFIYPEGDSDAVSISKRDVDLLEPDKFVNDTIIDFYIKYLKDQIPPDKQQRFHFFNSFFFRKLGDLEKYPTSSFDGRAAFLRVRKWTRKVNLFEKDFIFVPINNYYHWSLVVICHPGEIATFRDVDVGKLAKVPCILHMDSIRGTHLDIECRIRSYLWEAWEERQKEASEDIASKFSKLRFVSLELPQQQNCYDCGLFLLHYVELFLDEDPVGINPFKISKLNKFLNAHWFPTAEPSLKRRAIQNLIHNLLDNQSPATAVASNMNMPPENGLGLLTSSFGHGKEEGCNGDLTCSQAKQTAEMTVFHPTFLGTSLLIDRSGVSAGGDLYNDSGLPSQSSIDVQYPTFDRMSSFDEFKNAVVSGQETCNTYDYFESKENGFDNSVKIKIEAHELEEYNTEDVCWEQELCISNNNLDLLTSICNDIDNSNNNNVLEVVDKQVIDFNNDELHISKENEIVAVAESDNKLNSYDCDNNNNVGSRSTNSEEEEEDEEHVVKKPRFTTASELCPKSLQEEDLCL